MAKIIKNGGDAQPPAIPLSLSEGLDLFAATWLEQWTNAGGGVTIDTDGKAWFGFAEYHCSPAYTPPPADLPNEVSRSYDGFLDGRYHGGMLSMLDLLKQVPFGREAVKAHMRAHGINCYSRPAEVRS